YDNAASKMSNSNDYYTSDGVPRYESMDEVAKRISHSAASIDVLANKKRNSNGLVEIASFEEGTGGFGGKSKSFGYQHYINPDKIYDKITYPYDKIYTDEEME